MLWVDPVLARLSPVLGLLAAVGVAGLIWVLSRPRAQCPRATSLAVLTRQWAARPGIPGVLFRLETTAGQVIESTAGRLSRRGGAPVQRATPFHVASIGKLFTAVAVLRLAEKGVLDLDAPVASYLDPAVLRGLVVIDGLDHGTRITVRQLLTHRAGLGDLDRDWRFQMAILAHPRRVWMPADLLEHARRLTPAGPPGGQQAYASTGYHLLGLVMEAVTDMPYHTVIRQEVLDPLDLHRTFESVHEWPLARSGQPEPLQHYAGQINLGRFHPGFEFGDGGFVSTAEDLTRFGLALIDGRPFRDVETARLFFSPVPEMQGRARAWGHGPMMETVPGRPVVALQNGFWGLHLIIAPEDGWAAITALGQSNADPVAFWRDAWMLVEPKLRRDPAIRAGDPSETG